MSRSRLIYIVLFLGYISIALFNMLGALSVGTTVLFGLSLSALLASLSDAVNGFMSVLCQRNHMSYIAKSSISFIESKLKSAVPQNINSADFFNIKKNLEDQNPYFQKSIHPNVYWRTKGIKILRIIMYFLDACSILTFVISPFFEDKPIDLTKISIFITLCAFGFMCLNVFISEIQNDFVKKQNDFYNSTHILINLAYPDFATFLDAQLNHRESLLISKELRENDANKTQMEADLSVIKPVEDYSDGGNK